MLALPSLTGELGGFDRARDWDSNYLALCGRSRSIATLGPEGSWTDISFDLVGWIMFILGGAVRWWATLYIGGRKLDTVVADGPYSVCRNPIYVGTFLMAVGIAFFLQSLTFAIGVAFATTVYLWVTVPAEEMLLRTKFSQAFDDYCRRVPRYFPRFRNFHTSELLEISVAGLRGEALRTLRWIWLPVLCEAVAQLRTEAWWPHLLHVP